MLTLDRLAAPAPCGHQGCTAPAACAVRLDLFGQSDIPRPLCAVHAGALVVALAGAL